MLRSIGLVALALAALSAPSNARAQVGGDAEARRLALEQAQEARVAGNHQRALDFALRAGSLGMTPSLRSFIAEESSAVGHLAEALRAAMLCESEATANHAVNSRDALLASCRALIASLRPRVGYVVLHAEQPTDGLQIRVAGQPVNVILLDADYAVTPGDVAIDATGPGGSFASHVSVAVAAHVRVDVRLQPAPSASPPPSSIEPASARPADDPTTEAVVSSATGSTGPGHALSIAGIGVGAGLVVASVATLSYFFFVVVAHCDMSGGCTSQQDAQTASAQSMPLQAVGYGMLAVGGVLAVAGAIGFVVTGHAHADAPPGPRARRINVAPMIGGALGVALGAQF